ncbi:MAG: ABC transporter substrate-binding protein [Halobacteriaceae archaeon]
MNEQSRRTFLRTAGASATLGLAGCASLGGSGGLDSLNVAYMPIYPDMQYFQLAEEGYLDELDVSVTAKQFSDGPSIVQAYASGKFDVALFGVLPAQVLVDKGVAAKAVAANDKNSIGIFTTESFADRFAEEGADAFDSFESEHGRKFSFGTFPSGSVPDILLRYWIREELGLSVDDAVDVTYMGAGKVRQALLAGEIDGTSLLEPIPTIARMNDAPYTLLTEAASFVPGGQASALVLMRDDLRANHRGVAADFLRKHLQATEFINENPKQAARNASSVVGESVLPEDVAMAAMESPLEEYIGDPRQIVEGAKVYSRYGKRLGKLDAEVGTEDLFDFSLYDEVTG